MGRVEILQKRSGYRSLFWPLVLIGVGVIWLLSNMGIFGPQNLAVVLRLWPLLLIAIGLDLLLGRQSPTMGAVIGIGTLVLMLVLMLVGPAMGLAPNIELQTETFTEAVNEAESYRLELEIGVDNVTITPLDSGSDTLFNADVEYYGELAYTVSGGAQRTINLLQTSSPDSGLVGLAYSLSGQSFVSTWDLAVNPSVPLELDIDGGVGEMNFDLSTIILSNFKLNMGVGELTLSLPAPVESYTVTIDGGVGTVNIDLPEGAAVRLDADTGVGDVYLPSFMSRVSGDDDKVVGEEGVWESANFAAAEATITIVYDGGVGSLTLR